jgi:hypothetical protein
MCTGSDKRDIRYIVIKGTTYVRLGDIISYVEEIAATEETDVRNRLRQATSNLQKIER